MRCARGRDACRSCAGAGDGETCKTLLFFFFFFCSSGRSVFRTWVLQQGGSAWGKVKPASESPQWPQQAPQKGGGWVDGWMMHGSLLRPVRGPLQPTQPTQPSPGIDRLSLHCVWLASLCPVSATRWCRRLAAAALIGWAKLATAATGISAAWRWPSSGCSPLASSHRSSTSDHLLFPSDRKC